MDVWQLLLDIVILLGASLVFGGLCLRFGQSPLIGYLLAGMLLGGPGGLELIHSGAELESIAEIGVSLLLFSIGLEFSWQRVLGLGKKTLLSGVFQVGFTCAAGTFIAFACHFSWTEAIAIGAMVSLSSTACVLRVLNDQTEMDSNYGRSALAILLVQDIAVVPIALIMSVLPGSNTSEDSFIWPLLQIVLSTSVLIAALYLVLNVIAAYALSALTLKQNRELTVLLTVATGLGSAWAAHAVGISPAMGAFVAGMFLGNSPFATQIRADISSLRVVLLTLFFGAVGMVADPFWFLQHWFLVLSMVAVLIVGKTLVITSILIVLGKPIRIAVATGLCLAQIGEFAFVLGTIGKESGILEATTYQLVVSSTIVTLFLSPYLVTYAQRWGVWLERRFKKTLKSECEEPTSQGVISPDIVIIGYGPAGYRASLPLQQQDHHVLVVDLNSSGILKANENGFSGLIGDSTQLDILEHAGVGTASIVVITVPHHRTALLTLEGVKSLNPNARILIRSRFQIHSQEYIESGAHVVLGDEENVGDQLAAAVLKQFAEMSLRKRSTAIEDHSKKR